MDLEMALNQIFDIYYMADSQIDEGNGDLEW
jgi:hypothetical protein